MMFSDNQNIKITGTYVNFYFHCQRQLWLFAHHLNTEQDSDLVYQGKVIHESSYDRETKEVEIDHLKIDFLDIRNGVLHEIKKSDSWETAHKWQVVYYLYYLKKKGIEGLKGELNYPVQRKTVEVLLTPDKEMEMQNILNGIKEIILRKVPPAMHPKKSVCKKCSYYEFCYI